MRHRGETKNGDEGTPMNDHWCPSMLARLKSKYFMRKWNALGIASRLRREGKQGIKSKKGAIKCCKERKITLSPNECCNIPLYYGLWGSKYKSPKLESSEYKYYLNTGLLQLCIQMVKSHVTIQIPQSINSPVIPAKW